MSETVKPRFVAEGRSRKYQFREYEMTIRIEEEPKQESLQEEPLYNITVESCFNHDEFMTLEGADSLRALAFALNDWIRREDDLEAAGANDDQPDIIPEPES